MGPRSGVSLGTAANRTSAPWRRTAKLAGTLWIPVGLVVAFVSKEAGHPQASGWLFIVAGLVMMWIVGRHFGLSGKRTWARAVIGSVVVLVLVGGVIMSLWAMSGAPGIERTQ